MSVREFSNHQFQAILYSESKDYAIIFPWLIQHLPDSVCDCTMIIGQEEDEQILILILRSMSGESGRVEVAPGNYILMYSDGTLYACPEAYFRSEYLIGKSSKST